MKALRPSAITGGLLQPAKRHFARPSASPLLLVRTTAPSAPAASAQSPQLLRAVSSSSSNNNNNNIGNMALFPRVPRSDFGSLFRLLDDWESHRQDRGAAGGITSYSPSFDVREDRDAYHLDGELPGIAQKDINIEFTDPHTLVINGRTERGYTEGTPPGKRLEGGGGEAAAHEEGGGRAKKGAKAEEGGEHRYWVSERSVGEFQRSFSFPTRVNQDGVKASLKQGVLSVTVPKAAAPTTKRITVE